MKIKAALGKLKMMDYQQLEALVEVLRQGSFERAARTLNITPSAISQRIKTLEERVGAVLIVRGQPCLPTSVGTRLLHHAERVHLLEQEVRNEIEGATVSEKITVRIAVNADSLVTWFCEAMKAFDDVYIHVLREDQEHTFELLWSGDVAAAVSSTDVEVAGCDRRKLGHMRYRAVATPQFIEKNFPDGVTPAALSQAVGLRFDTKDDLNDQWTENYFGKSCPIPTHWLPSTHGILQGTLAGLGWGINPEILVREHLSTGILQELISDAPVDVPLYWYHSRVAQPLLSSLTASVEKVCRAFLN
ncbi:MULTISPECIES: LysR family transcriptional regulator ArgP [Rhizobium]|uniref:LysR family transcriptional regulator ArgP n=1 Tax=Rhizobium TaxID=379 RepID=UPI001F3A43BC|nr:MULTISPECIES: LysR family transcriptional regulator ArgP [Rhizobium]